MSHIVREQFFLLMPDTTRPGRGHGVEIENEDELLQSPRLILRPEAGIPAFEGEASSCPQAGAG